MKFTVLHHTHQGMNRYSISGVGVLSLGIFIVAAVSFSSILISRYYLSTPKVDFSHTQAALASMEQSLVKAKQEVNQARKQTQLQLDEVTRRVGVLQAEIMRINAVGKRLLSMAGIETNEFDFDVVPSVGGPEVSTTSQININSAKLGSIGSSLIHSDNLTLPLDNIEEQLQQKKNQLAILESVLLNKEMDIASYISGRPVTRGWNSSVFGKRIDPFSGHPAWHEGMDFAGKEGDPIVATAAGVVSFVGMKSGYGLTVEINHGNNIKTRYGHNKQILVEVGTVVEKGNTIAKMGSSGRSTGPHVHYEVLKKDRPVNPKKYVWRKGK